MKIIVGIDTGTYTFAPATRKITLSSIVSGNSTLTGLSLEQIILITNVTDNIILYNFADPALGGSIASNVITVNYDTSSMSSTDRLMIIVDVPDTQEDLLRMLARLVKISESLGNVDTNNRQRVSVDYSPNLTVATLTTVANAVPVGNVATLGGLDPRFNMIDQARTAYNTGIRNQLTWS
jgi:hypothetical protein